jgi:hypothetical protein
MAGVRHENKPESVYLPRSDEYLTDGNTLSGNATNQELAKPIHSTTIVPELLGLCGRF